MEFKRLIILIGFKEKLVCIFACSYLVSITRLGVSDLSQQQPDFGIYRVYDFGLAQTGLGSFYILYIGRVIPSCILTVSGPSQLILKTSSKIAPVSVNKMRIV